MRRMTEFIIKNMTTVTTMTWWHIHRNTTIETQPNGHTNFISLFSSSSLRLTFTDKADFSHTRQFLCVFGICIVLFVVHLNENVGFRRFCFQISEHWTIEAEKIGWWYFSISFVFISHFRLNFFCCCLLLKIIGVFLDRTSSNSIVLILHSVIHFRFLSFTFVNNSLCQVVWDLLLKRKSEKKRKK